VKSVWKSFKTDFAEIEENLDAARGEIREEIQLASEETAHGFRQLQLIEFKENQLHRQKQVVAIEENRDFHLQQISALMEAQDRRIQKAIKEEGNVISNIFASWPGG
jgi:hypothetical protein